jgi:hypothetical protein
MAVEVFDLLKIAHEEGKRKPIFNSERLHAWVHVYANTGDKDDMHCHNADQTFACLRGSAPCIFRTGAKPS